MPPNRTLVTLALAGVLAALAPTVAGHAQDAVAVDRVFGEGRVETAVELSVEFFDAADTAVVATSETFVDALAAGPLAAAADGPLLLNPSDALAAVVRDELVDRLAVDTVYLMGGREALSSEVEEDLESEELTVRRLGGENRFATAALAAEEAARLWGGEAGAHVLVALGSHPAGPSAAWPDALAAGPWAARAELPVLLTAQGSVPDETQTALDRLGTDRVTVVGGPAAVPESTKEQLGDEGTTRDRVGGEDRFHTSVLAAQRAEGAGADLSTSLLATGTRFPDALGAGPAAAAVGGGLLLLHPADLDRSDRVGSLLWDRRDSLARLVVAGGPTAVPAPTVEQVHARVNGLGDVPLRLASLGSFEEPLGVFQPDAGGSTLYVLERTGRVQQLEGGARRLLLRVDTRASGERGLLGMAFHPDYPADARLYVHRSHPDDGDTVLEEYHAPPDGSAERLRGLDRIHQPASNHNGGTVTFGPDGRLYLFLGDGGGGNDEFDTAQDLADPRGSVLRYDVSRSGSGEQLAARDNPFVGPDTDDRIWASGLRNPFRADFDPARRTLLIGDVGQSGWEEIDAVDAGAPAVNYGWPCREGRHAGPGPDKCDAADDLTDPVLEYPRSDDACAVIGGHVYRGDAVPALRGHYFYGDLCAGFVRSFRLQDGAVVERSDWTDELGFSGAVRSFGRDAAGELYVMNGGEVFRIVPG